MLRRYFTSVVPAGAPIAPTGVHFSSDNTINITNTQETHQSYLALGTAGAVITIQLTSKGPGEADFYVDAFGGNMSVGNTFTVTLDSNGTGSFKVIFAVSNQPGRNSATVILTIISASTGALGNPLTQSYSHTTTP